MNTPLSLEILALKTKLAELELTAKKEAVRPKESILADLDAVYAAIRERQQQAEVLKREYILCQIFNNEIDALSTKDAALVTGLGEGTLRAYTSAKTIESEKRDGKVVLMVNSLMKYL